MGLYASRPAAPLHGYYLAKMILTDRARKEREEICFFSLFAERWGNLKYLRVIAKVCYVFISSPKSINGKRTNHPKMRKKI